MVFICFLMIGCQANYIRDVRGGAISPSTKSDITCCYFKS
ncbi:colicin release lysis protein [Edwardsiella tarda]|nr:colicin release lysis protein [Edwardsiella tarda]